MCRCSGSWASPSLPGAPRAREGLHQRPLRTHHLSGEPPGHGPLDCALPPCAARLQPPAFVDPPGCATAACITLLAAPVHNRPQPGTSAITRPMLVRCAHPMVEGTPWRRPSRCTLYLAVSWGILRLAYACREGGGQWSISGMAFSNRPPRGSPLRRPTSTSTRGHLRPVQREGMGTRCFRLKPSPV